ncbi:hypothetical protein GGR54DRAFT_115875 [Hypoxylon sp. NC1633]|nr:hypothetical protein GGR54DRAFT_115875 [Hypoxylon sp. NC1633]
MAPVTEIVVLPLKSDADDKTVAAVVATNTQVLLSQLGCQRVHSCREHEDASKLRFFVDWDSLEAHQAFSRNTAAFGPFAKLMGSIADPKRRTPPLHVSFTPSPPTILRNSGPEAKSPFVEMLHFYFPGSDDGCPEDVVRKATDVANEFLIQVLPLILPHGCTGETAVGWTLERDIRFRDQSCRALVVLLGWTSPEAFMTARETEPVSKLVRRLLSPEGLEGLVGYELVLVNNTTVERGD